MLADRSKIPVSNVGEDFTAEHRHGLPVQRVRRVAFQWGTTSGIDARLFNLRKRAPQHNILKVQIGITTVSDCMTHAVCISTV